MRTCTVYLLTNRSGTLYVGITGDLARRLAQHKARAVPGFTSKYRLDRLVYAESFPTAAEAIRREKQLRGWRREKKIELLERVNPGWRNVADDWSSPPRSPGEPGRWARGHRRGMGLEPPP